MSVLRPVSLFLFMLFTCLPSAKAEQTGASVPADNAPSSIIVSVSKDDKGNIIINHSSRPVTINFDSFDPKATDFKPIKFGTPVLAKNKRTAGWTVEYENCCTSYPVPTVLLVYQDEKHIQKIADGQMIWNWIFWQNGEEVAVQTGPTHGDQCTFRLYDVKSAKTLSEESCHQSKLPDWASLLNNKDNLRKIK